MRLDQAARYMLRTLIDSNTQLHLSPIDPVFKKGYDNNPAIFFKVIESAAKRMRSTIEVTNELPVSGAFATLLVYGHGKGEDGALIIFSESGIFYTRDEPGVQY